MKSTKNDYKKNKKNNVWDNHREAHMNDIGFKHLQNSLLFLSSSSFLSHYSFSSGAMYTSLTSMLNNQLPKELK